MSPHETHGEATEATEATEAAHELEQLGYAQELRRTMSLTDVVVYGMIYMVPMAPVAVFGTIHAFGHGMSALVYVVAAVAMVFSAISYREMALRYPIAGSVYSYVRRGLHPFAGFIAGWAILLDYLLLPALLSVFSAIAMTTVVPGVPPWVWIVVFVVAAAAINLAGISVTARMNMLFMIIQLLVLAVFVVGAVVKVAQGEASFTLAPLYRPDAFSWGIVFGAIPLAALSFIGFDAISTLNEEAEGGGPAVARATMIVLVAVTFLFVLQVYAAAAFAPVDGRFANSDAELNAFYDISGTVLGHWFKVVMTLTSALIAIFANSIASQATSSRLVFSMARDRQLPHLLARVVPTRRVPQNAMLLIAGLSLVIGVVGSAKSTLLVTLVTFGALSAYILLHVAVFWHLGVRGTDRRVFSHLVSPVVGAAALLYALWSADPHAKILGLCWLAVGIVLAVVFARRGTLDTHEHDPVAQR